MFLSLGPIVTFAIRPDLWVWYVIAWILTVITIVFICLFTVFIIISDDAPEDDYQKRVGESIMAAGIVSFLLCFLLLLKPTHGFEWINAPGIIFFAFLWSCFVAHSGFVKYMRLQPKVSRPVATKTKKIDGLRMFLRMEN